jgi:hypothetical protein
MRLPSQLLLLILLIFLYIFPDKSAGQNFKPYIGIHGGLNFTRPDVLHPYTIITLLNGEHQNKREYYPLIWNPGYQLGFSFLLSVTHNVTIGLLPEISQYSLGYSSTLDFFDNQGNPASQIETTTKQRLGYVTIPLVAYYFPLKNKWSPYLAGGAAYAFLRNAQHDVNTHTILLTASGNIDFNISNSVNYSSEFIRSKLSLFAGAGYRLDLTQLYLLLDLAYWCGLHNISYEANRFHDQIISGSTYDVPDDLKLNHWMINLSLLFPVNKAISKGSLDCVTFKRRKNP